MRESYLMVWAVFKRSNVQVLFLLLACLFLACPYPGWADSGTAIIQPGKKIDQTRRAYKEGELLVKFKPGTPDEKRIETHERIGSTIIEEFRSIGVQRVRLKAGLSVEDAVRLYQADPDVEYAEPNYIVEIQK
jgi:hypothetical protein